jgi:hypothetical protein
MSITILTPRNLIGKHPEAFAVSLILFMVGFMLGLQPQYGQPIIEEAKKREVEPTAIATNFKQILANNGLISAVLWSGWFFTPFFGVAYLPPAIMVYNVGAAFGAIVSYVSPLQSVMTLVSFGILEASGFVFAFAGSLLFPKYAILKLLGKTTQFTDLFTDASTLLFYSFVLLLCGAILETLLINPLTTMFAVASGLIVTFLVVRFFILKAEA